MKSGFSSSKLSERPTSESIPGISGDGRRWFVDDFYETIANVYGGANNLFGAFGGAETNDNNAMQAMFNHNNDGSFSLGSGNDTAIITTDPYEGDYHFAIQGPLSYVGNLDVEVNWLHKYFMEGYVKSVGAVQSKLYMGFYCRDADGSFIDLRNCGGVSNTTLSQDLEDGDTYAYVTDASVFADTSATYYFRNLLFFPPNHAKYFRPWWHTRIGYGSPTMYYSERDTSNNRLRLSTNAESSGNTTWSGGFIPAGTPVSRGVAGGTYNYCISGGGTISTSWAQLDQTVNGNGYPSRNSSCTFRQGTKYIRPMTLNNYGQTSTSALYIDNWRFINLTDPGQSSPGEYSNYSKAVNNIQGTRLTKQGALHTNDLNEIVIPGHGGVFSYGNSIYKSSNLKLEIDPEDATTRGGITSSSAAGIKAAGGTLNDLSGNSNNMNIEGNPYMGFGTSKHDGSGDNLYRGTPSWTDYMTFGCWLKIASGQDNGGTYWFMDSNRGTSSVSARIYSDIVNGSGSDDLIRYRGYDNGAGGGFTLTSTSTINDGVWHYIVAVWEKTSKRLYFDGRLEASVTQAGASDSAYSSLQVGGAYYNSAVQHSINGQVGPFHMYTNEVLSDDQIYHNYNYFWESRYRWLSDSTVGAAINATNNSISY